MKNKRNKQYHQHFCFFYISSILSSLDHCELCSMGLWFDTSSTFHDSTVSSISVPFCLVWIIVNSVAWAYGTTQALPFMTVHHHQHFGFFYFSTILSSLDHCELCSVGLRYNTGSTIYDSTPPPTLRFLLFQYHFV